MTQPLKPLTQHTGRLVPFIKADVDTDQIIPARYLKGTEKTGLGQYLFYDWRTLPDGTPNPAFTLTQPKYAGATVLLGGSNFGCGSSREHAPWALKDFGITVVLAESFADIFSNNALKNQLLVIAAPPKLIKALADLAQQYPETTVTVDVAAQTVELPQPLHSQFGPHLLFKLDPFRQTCLLNGVDDVGYTLTLADAITAYEATHPSPFALA
jgi:3-isopropylmalate/(R)-2-methylmalate dehydratase small subunit